MKPAGADAMRGVTVCFQVARDFILVPALVRKTWDLCRKSSLKSFVPMARRCLGIVKGDLVRCTRFGGRDKYKRW